MAADQRHRLRPRPRLWDWRPALHGGGHRGGGVEGDILPVQRGAVPDGAGRYGTGLKLAI